MGSPTKGRNWELYGKRTLAGEIEYERWYDGVELEHHIHLPGGVTILFREVEAASVKLLIPTPSRPCSQCGREIEFPAFDELEPFGKYAPKYNRAILKHAWAYHREDFPPEFTSLTQFMKWSTTPEGKAWDKKQFSLASKDEILAEAERIIQGEKG